MAIIVRHERTLSMIPRALVAHYLATIDTYRWGGKSSTGGETKERMEALEKIDQLNKRKEKGQITEEEYKKMRQEIIVSF